MDRLESKRGNMEYYRENYLKTETNHIFVPSSQNIQQFQDDIYINHNNECNFNASSDQGILCLDVNDIQKQKRIILQNINFIFHAHPCCYEIYFRCRTIISAFNKFAYIFTLTTII